MYIYIAQESSTFASSSEKKSLNFDMAYRSLSVGESMALFFGKFLYG